MADDKSQEQIDAEQLQKDVEGFNAELIPLLGKFNVGLGATAFITPDGRIGARPTLFRAPAAPAKAPADAATDTAAPATPAPVDAPPVGGEDGAKPLESSEA